ncbi:hypothetical protein E1267_14630 [Nonomuraea longispora]|uniref:Uncharacterized protein n=1 Tax=Nonomuraea longispora TaxID=1848320 RepID=A0A4R4NDD2_9ACTN|nr:hypothetical protein [Nonomuraea longispora]TDC06985.1 hypothetical protein E1267_14630 [Nonomuraea longispora]
MARRVRRPRSRLAQRLRSCSSASGRHSTPAVPQVCRWFEDRGYDREWLSEPGTGYGVHRLTGTPQPMVAGRHMFTFTRHDKGQALGEV